MLDYVLKSILRDLGGVYNSEDDSFKFDVYYESCIGFTVKIVDNKFLKIKSAVKTECIAIDDISDVEITKFSKNKYRFRVRQRWQEETDVDMSLDTSQSKSKCNWGGRLINHRPYVRETGGWGY